MLLKFRSRGCLITAFLVGLVALLSCGGLFLLVTPRPAPDAHAELKQLPLYAGAQDVSYFPGGRLPNMPSASAGTTIRFSTSVGYGTTSSASTIGAASGAAMSFDTLDEPQKVFAYYLAEFDKMGWDCFSTGVGAGTGSGAANCTRLDQGLPQLVFTDFPPWVEISMPVSMRSARIDAYNAYPDNARTRVDIDYEVLVVR